MHIHQTYLSLPDDLYATLDPIATRMEIVLWNEELAQSLGLSTWANTPEGREWLMGRSSEHPRFAQAYAGHQYGHFTILGDGRAMVLGEVETTDGMIDLQLKGSGMTPYSRRGDGKATLASMLREHVISEAMFQLGIPTTRSLAVYRTDETVMREQAHQGAMLLRTARSHLRVGTFEYARILDDFNVLRQLVDYAILRHAPHLVGRDDAVVEFFHQVVLRQADLMARWQSIGFVHGVMNTDNMTISGDTIDYGPCAFLDAYEPERTFSSIDHQGRYAYARQPYIASWNLSKLAVSLLPLVHTDVSEGVRILNGVLGRFEAHYQERYRHYFGRKFGLSHATKKDDVFIRDFLRLLEQHQLDFTNSFVHLTRGTIEDLGIPMVEWTLFSERWKRRIEEDGTMADAMRRMRRVNPVVIPRNHMLQQAVERADFHHDETLIHELIGVLQSPYDYDKPRDPKYLEPDPSGRRFVSYCGT